MCQELLESCSPMRRRERQGQGAGWWCRRQGIRELSPECNWGPQPESHLVGVNSVAILVCVNGGQGGGHSKSNQCDGQ